MRLAILYSGGKDSNYAMMKAKESNEIVCLISVTSKNKYSYMFHTPNIDITKMQAESIELPLIERVTEGVKEDELNDLKDVISETKKKFNIDGIVTGAVASVYQASRIQKICDELGLKCINPLWQREHVGLLRSMIKDNLHIIISGVFAPPLGKEWLGKEINDDIIDELARLQKKHGINPSGEGGEIETTVIDAPFFKKKIEIIESEIKWFGDSGVFMIKKARLIEKTTRFHR
jgi:diphthine-ammonia ligase